MHRKDVRCLVALLAMVVPMGLALVTPPPGLAFQQGTPEPTYSCDAMGIATPGASHAGMATAESMTEMEMGIDLLYIDMMIPHHASIIAMAEAASPRLTDERLREIAQSIVEAQGAEIEELHALRETLSGSAIPMAMDDAHMAMMMEMMPGMGSMDEMASQMDPEGQVQAFCSAENPDLAFIELTIPHHEMAITASESVLEQSTNDEVRAFAERVIADQQREIDELEAILVDLAG